jgi:hypothetical protein
MNLTIFNELDFLRALRAFFAELQVPVFAIRLWWWCLGMTNIWRLRILRG